MKNLVVITLILLTCQAGIAAEAIFGCVDTDQVLQASREYKKIDSEARLKIELKEEEGQRMMQEIMKLEEEIGVLTKEKQQPLITEYRRKVEALERFRDQSRDEIMEAQSLDLKRIANKIKNIIEEVSSKRKLTIVFELKAILYQDKTKIVDITNAVIKELNRKYDEEVNKIRGSAPKRSN